MSDQTTVDPLQEALLEIIKKTEGAVEQGVSFLSAQIPDVLHQLLLWKMVESLLQCVFSIFVVIFTVWLWKTVIHKVSRKTPYEERWEDITVLLPIIVSVLTTTLFCCSFNLVWLQIWIAPKIYLIEYASKLIK